jgi:hypothetical protein
MTHCIGAMRFAKDPCDSPDGVEIGELGWVRLFIRIKVEL